jgi:hypothetical protein
VIGFYTGAEVRREVWVGNPAHFLKKVEDGDASL